MLSHESRFGPVDFVMPIRRFENNTEQAICNCREDSGIDINEYFG